jgi:hypothetical protein
MENKAQASHMAYQLQCLMRVLSLAVQGQDAAGLSFEQCGGSTVLELAGDMAGELAELADRGGA